MKIQLYTLAFLMISAPLFSQNNMANVQITSRKLTESVYLLQGSGGNMGLLVGEDGALLIDDQFAPLSEKIKTAIAELNGGEVKVLVNTHLHGDHSGGNDNFGRWGALIVAQDNVRERMMGGNQPRAKEALPVVTFPDRISLHWNNEELNLYHFAPGHTDGDVLIHFTKQNVLHTGDLFVRTGYPFLDLNNGGSINGYIENMDHILELTNAETKIIPGHGDLATREDVKRLRECIVDIRNTVQAALTNGTKVEDVSGLPIASKYDSVFGTTGFINGRAFVLAVAESLTRK